jgi:hypothetical protein
MRECQYDENRVFLQRAESAFRELFLRAKQADELNFAASLSPEFRPYRQNSAVDAQYAFSDYASFLSRNVEPEIRPRTALAFYAHLAEASGFWEVVKNLIGVAQGQKFNVMPFAQFTAKYGASEGSPIPNANKLMRSLVKSSTEAGFLDLASTFSDAFDADLRNAFAHADYCLSKEGVFVQPRYGQERLIDWRELNVLLDRAMLLYLSLNDIRVEYCRSYGEPRHVVGTLNPREPATQWKVEFKSPEGAMLLFNGRALLQFASFPNLPALAPSEV